MSEPQLRAKVRRGLLKVEQLHALARAVYYGQRGAISAREVYDQVNACSCLTLILACIVYWQARESSRLAAAPDFPFDPGLLRHVSPIEWKNVVLYGEIKMGRYTSNPGMEVFVVSGRMVAVSGAWSYSGRRVAARLHRAGYTVVSLTSRPVPDPDPHAGAVGRIRYDFRPGALV